MGKNRAFHLTLIILLCGVLGLQAGMFAVVATTDGGEPSAASVEQLFSDWKEEVAASETLQKVEQELLDVKTQLVEVEAQLEQQTAVEAESVKKMGSDHKFDPSSFDDTALSGIVTGPDSSYMEFFFPLLFMLLLGDEEAWMDEGSLWPSMGPYSDGDWGDWGYDDYYEPYPYDCYEVCEEPYPYDCYDDYDAPYPYDCYEVCDGPYPYDCYEVCEEPYPYDCYDEECCDGYCEEDPFNQGNW